MLISLSINIINYKKNVEDIDEKDFKIKKKIIKNSIINNKKLPNIYFILMDELTSPAIINELYNIDVKNIIHNENLHYFKMKSSGISTINTISNLFYEENVENLNAVYKYPFYKQSSQDIPFLNFLIQNKYKIFFQGNGLVNCYGDIYRKCIIDKLNYLNFDLVWEYTAFTNLKIKFFNDFKIFKDFLQRNHTLFDDSSEFFDYPEITKFNILFDELNKKKNNNFFFIHNIGPHVPNRKIDCSYYKTHQGHQTKQKYYENLLCNLNELNKLLNTITLKNPDSLIYIFGDHGTLNFYEFEKWKPHLIKKNGKRIDADMFRTKDVFLAKYSNKKCENNYNLKLIMQITKDLKDCLINY